MASYVSSTLLNGSPHALEGMLVDRPLGEDEPEERERVAAATGCGDLLATRKVIAIALTIHEGVDPFSLVSNTLDEEPCDAVLTLAGEAHFAWRDRLWRVAAAGSGRQ